MHRIFKYLLVQDRLVYFSQALTANWPTDVDAWERQQGAAELYVDVPSDSNGAGEESEEEAIPDQRQGLRSGKQPVQEGLAEKKRKRGAAATSRPRGGVQFKPPLVRRQYVGGPESDDDEEDRETL